MKESINKIRNKFIILDNLSNPRLKRILNSRIREDHFSFSYLDSYEDVHHDTHRDLGYQEHADDHSDSIDQRPYYNEHTDSGVDVYFDGGYSEHTDEYWRF